MPAQKRDKPLYQRGTYKLYRREGRANYEIVFYDAARKRERSVTAGTADEHAAKSKLDTLYVERTGGDAFCPECGQPRSNAGVYVTAAIADYLALHHDTPKEKALRPRLQHVLNYVIATHRAGARCGQVDEQWIGGMRKWLATQPIISPLGKVRPRSLSTIENSVLQLAAAINKCGGVEPKFKSIQMKEVNQTPTYRASLKTLIAMFAYCLQPKGRSDKERERRMRERQHLLSFLRISVATMARPDAALDVSTDPKRRQWHADELVLRLNPHGRRQTKKFRATIPLARQMAALLADVKGPLIPVVSVKSAWNSMAAELNLPGEGQGGLKLIRRSVANIVRERLPTEAWGELEMFLGHAKFDDTSDLYAPFRPDYLRRALPVVESLIEEIEIGCSGAFYRAVTASTGVVVRLGSVK